MFLSGFDIFKIGVGPSSSHTMGPMLAATRFLDALRLGTGRVPGAGPAARVEATLHGSLAFTGKGHATDRAVICSRRPCCAAGTRAAAAATGNRFAAGTAGCSAPRAAQSSAAGHHAWSAADAARSARTPHRSRRLRSDRRSGDTDGERKQSTSVVIPRSWQNKDVTTS